MSPKLPLLAQIVVFKLGLSQGWWRQGLTTFVVALMKGEFLGFTFLFRGENWHFHFVEILWRLYVFLGELRDFMLTKLLKSSLGRWLIINSDDFTCQYLVVFLFRMQLFPHVKNWFNFKPLLVVAGGQLALLEVGCFDVLLSKDFKISNFYFLIDLGIYEWLHVLRLVAADYSTGREEEAQESVLNILRRPREGGLSTGTKTAQLSSWKHNLLLDIFLHRLSQPLVVQFIGFHEVAGLMDFEFESSAVAFDFICCYLALLSSGLVQDHALLGLHPRDLGLLLLKLTLTAFVANRFSTLHPLCLCQKPLVRRTNNIVVI